MSKKISLVELRNNWKGFQEEAVEIKTAKPKKRKFSVSFSNTQVKLFKKNGLLPTQDVNLEAAMVAYKAIRKTRKSKERVARQKKHLASVIVKRNAPKRVKGGKKKKG